MKQLDLFSPLQIGDLTLPNRIIMAPLTRCRAGAGVAPTALNALYYQQRASAGLIISEATPIMPEGHGYPDTPGIYTDQQLAGWRLVTDAVHEAGGRIFAQLWHVGRISHPVFQPHQQLPVAPSAIAAPGNVMTPTGKEPLPVPRALETAEIPGIVEQYATATRNAQQAGFDGVEIHGAHGYLIDAFLRDSANQRTDRYGGSLENRLRFMSEVVEAVVGAWSAERVGIRFSPFVDQKGADSDPLALFTAATKRVASFGLAYLHLREAKTKPDPATAVLRSHFSGVLMVNDLYTKERGNEAILSGRADCVAYGVPFIANPDLPRRFQLDSPLNEADRATFYGGGAAGYTDYPALSPSTFMEQ